MTKRHFLKIESNYIDRVLDGSKLFEIRYNDRDFQAGDIIILIENVKPNRRAKAIITYVLNFPQGLKDGYVGLGIKLIGMEYGE